MSEQAAASQPEPQRGEAADGVPQLAPARATAGRRQVTTDDGALDVHVVAAGLSGHGGAVGEGRHGATTPEHLLAAGFAACFRQSLALAAADRGVRVDADVEAEVSLQPSTTGYEVTVDLVARTGLPPEQAEAVVREAEALCPVTSTFAGPAVRVRAA